MLVLVPLSSHLESLKGLPYTRPNVHKCSVYIKLNSKFESDAQQFQKLCVEQSGGSNHC